MRRKAREQGDGGGHPSPLPGDDADHLQNLAGVAPLVVVPSDDFDEGAVQGNAGVGVEDRGGRIRRGSRWRPPSRWCSRARPSWHLRKRPAWRRRFSLVGGFLGEFDGEVDHGDVGGGDAEGHAGELLFSSGMTLPTALAAPVEEG